MNQANFNDGRAYTVNFAWEADVQESHYNHYLIQITDGHIPDQCDLHWPTRREPPGTANLLWGKDKTSNPTRGVYVRSGLTKSTWSVVISPSGFAWLYDQPDASGSVLYEAALDVSQPWYVRFMVSDGTSSGFPSGNACFKLYSFVVARSDFGPGVMEMKETTSGRQPEQLVQLPSPFLRKPNSAVDSNKNLDSLFGGYNSTGIELGVDSVILPGDGVPEVTAVLDGGFTWNSRGRYRHDTYTTHGRLYIIADQEFLEMTHGPTLLWELDHVPGPPYGMHEDRIDAVYHNSTKILFTPTDVPGIYLFAVKFSGKESMCKAPFTKDVVLKDFSEEYGRTMISFTLKANEKSRSKFYSVR